jgi:hypothetical protein
VHREQQAHLGEGESNRCRAALGEHGKNPDSAQVHDEIIITGALDHPGSIALCKACWAPGSGRAVPQAVET